MGLLNPKLGRVSTACQLFFSTGEGRGNTKFEQMARAMVYSYLHAVFGVRHGADERDEGDNHGRGYGKNKFWLPFFLPWVTGLLTPLEPKIPPYTNFK